LFIAQVPLGMLGISVSSLFFAGPGLCLDVSGSDIVPKLLSPTRQHFGRGGSNRAKRSPQVLDGAQWVLLADKGRAYGCLGTSPAHRGITAVPSQERAEDRRPLVIDAMMQ